MEDNRINPDVLLKKIKKENKPSNYGKLKIFFGYAAGVGKTYTMLEAAHMAKKAGVDVVIGYVEPHIRPETMVLLDGLEDIPTLELKHNGISIREFNLDEAIKRNPQLIIVDELAHTNLQGCRHSKRYQDINELLKLGIDVYTTVNVQHIESLNDIVASITGVIVRERIPDSMFDNAEQVEFVDIEPTELIERLNDGKIYNKLQTQSALKNFFVIENLVALREIALRRCADRITRISEKNRVIQGNNYYVDEHILVCLSSSPSNPKIIRTGSRMANAFKGRFTALFVETPDFKEIGEENLKRLRQNINLATQLGANIETINGDDIAFQIAEFARLSGVSKIVLGRNNAKRKNIFSKPSLTEKLTGYAPNIDIYIIPDKKIKGYKSKKYRDIDFNILDIIKSIVMFLTATGLSAIFYKLHFSESNIIMIYILSVLIISVITSKRMYSLILSILSVLSFNFFFTLPRFTLKVYDNGYPVTFLMMFICAFMASSLAVRLKQYAKQSVQRAYRTSILLETNQLLQKAQNKDNIIDVTANQLIKLLNRDIVFYDEENNQLKDPLIFLSKEGVINNEYISENEKAVANWVFKNNKHAGATTNTLGNSKCLYLAVRINEDVYGVVGIVIGNEPLLSFENSLLLSILGECALALETKKLSKEREEAAILAQNEQLRANLLRSISHDLRTPLTSISGNAGILISSEGAISEEKRIKLYEDIYEESLWLINLVENLLAVTKIEDGTMHLNMVEELLDEVVFEALNHINRKNDKHKIIVKEENDFVISKIDARLIIQVIINIVDNAIKYTPKDEDIIITIKKENKNAVIEIADGGKGISEESKEKIFDMFYTENNKIADSKRSLGLGLALCKSIITVHNGTIEVFDNKPKGAIFKITLPLEEVKVYE